MAMPRGAGARNRRGSRRAAEGGISLEGVSKALEPGPAVVASAATGEELDVMVARIASDLGVNMAAFDADASDIAAAVVGDGVEYEGDPDAGFEVVGFQIGDDLDRRLRDAVSALVRGSEDASPIVRLRLEELTMRAFAAPAPSPLPSPPLDGVSGLSLEWDAVLAPEGALTDDGRAFAPGSIRWRDLPLTLSAMLETAEGHDGAKVCGRIDRIWRDEAAGLIRASGVFDDSEFGRDVARMVDEKVLRGNSVDLAIHDYDYGPRSRWFDDDGNWAPQAVAEGDDADLVDVLFDEPEEGIIYVVTDAVIGMSTVVPFPAFSEGVIVAGRSLAAGGSPAVWTLTHDASYAVRRGRPRGTIEALTAAAKRTGVLTAAEHDRLDGLGYSVVWGGGVSVVPKEPALVLASAGTVIEEVGGGGSSGSSVSTTGGLGGGGGSYTFERDATEHFAVAASGFTPERALTAAVTPPTHPPPGWFVDPGLDELTQLVVTDEGRLYGHAAGWSSCHTGFADVCVTPPRSQTGYRFFHLKEVECDDGTLVAVGTITLEAPHANQNLGLVEAQAHYDNTGMAAADIVMGEDDYGIWFAGAARPHLDAEMIRELRGASLSGDWRNYEGNLELIGLLAVNVPGFPIPRVHARVASGVVQALVAAGLVTRGATRPLDDVLAEIDAEERAVGAGARAQLAALASDELAGIAGEE